MHCSRNRFAPVGSRNVTAMPALLSCSANRPEGPGQAGSPPPAIRGQDLMKILIASTPATGHLNPLLAIARILIAEGHEITCLTGTAMRDRIESSGAKFRPLPADADFDLRDDVFARCSGTEDHSARTGMVARRHRAAVRRHHPRAARGPAAGSAGLPGRRHHRRRYVFRRAADAARTARETASRRSLRHIVSALASPGRRADISSACRPQRPRRSATNTPPSRKNMTEASISRSPAA